MNKWYYSEGPKTKGPISAEALQEKIKSGEISKGTLVWCKGDVDWRPVESAFDMSTIANASLVFGQDTTIPSEMPEPPSSPSADEKLIADGETKNELPIMEQNESSTINFPRKFYGLIAIMIASAVTFFSLHANQDVSDYSAFISFWIVALLAFISSAAATLWQYKIYTNTIDKSDEFRAGKFRLVYYLGLSALIVFTLIFASQIPTLQRVGTVRKSYDTFTMDVNPAANTITVTGTIGPSFVSKLQKNLDLYSGLDTLIITSAGGLMDQALAAKDIIQKHSLITIARKECNSACIIVLMSGKERYADWDMKLGFHGASEITKLGGLDNDFGEKDADNFMLSEGIPEKIVKSGFGSGIKELTLVSPVEISEQSHIGLLDGQEEIHVADAKWRMIEARLEGIKSRGFDFSAPFAAIREYAPAMVDKHADALFAAMMENDMEKVKVAIASVVGEIVPQAIQSADSEALINYIESSSAQIEYLINLDQWAACRKYADGNNADQLNLLSTEHLKSEAAALSKLIQSAGQKKWTQQPIPEWARIQSDELATKAMQILLKAGLDIENFEKDDRVYCSFTYTYMKLIMSQPEIEVAPILRAIHEE